MNGCGFVVNVQSQRLVRRDKESKGHSEDQGTWHSLPEGQMSLQHFFASVLKVFRGTAHHPLSSIPAVQLGGGSIVLQGQIGEG